MDPTAKPVDMTALRALTEERYQVVLPGDGPRLVQILSSPRFRHRSQGVAKPVKPMGPASSAASVQHQLEEQAKVATEIIETKDAEIALAQDNILCLRLAGLKEIFQASIIRGKDEKPRRPEAKMKGLEDARRSPEKRKKRPRRSEAAGESLVLSAGSRGSLAHS